MAVKSDTGTVANAEVANDTSASAAEPSNEALLAELRAGQAAGQKPVGAAPATDDSDDEDLDAAADDADDDDDGPDDDGDGDEDEDDDATDDDESDEDAAPADPPDPETAKRMAALRVTEKRQRQALERERAAFEAQRTEFEAQRKELTGFKSRFDQLAARVKYDSYSVLKELGVPDEDMEYHGQQLVAYSPKYAAKPEYRTAAERAMRERELRDDVVRSRTEVAEVKKTLEEREKHAAIARDTDAYLTRVTKRAGDEAPLTKKLIANNPKRARDDLAVTAFKLSQKLGRLPSAKVVIAAHEKRLAKSLRDLGVDAPAATTTTPSKPPTADSSKSKTAPAGKKPAVATPAPQPNGVVHHPSYDELMDEIRAGKHLE